MAYNTNNPLGSKDPKDLYDNATNFDYYANGPDPMYPNRFGQFKLSIEGMNQQFIAAQTGREIEFQEFLAASAFVFVGDYGAGLNFTNRNQYMIRDGIPYRVAPSTTLPYTTTGNWALESVNFTPVSSDDILRQDLALPDGSNLVGYNAGLTSTINRTLEERLRERVSILDYGVVSSVGVTQTALLQLALDEVCATGKELYIPNGFYLKTGPLTINAVQGGSLRCDGMCYFIPEAVNTSVFTVVSTNADKPFTVDGVGFNNAGNFTGCVGLRIADFVGFVWRNVVSKNMGTILYAYATAGGPNSYNMTLDNVMQFGKGSFRVEGQGTKRVFDVRISNVNQFTGGGDTWEFPWFQIKRGISVYLTSISGQALSGVADGVDLQGQCEGVFLTDVIIPWPKIGVTLNLNNGDAIPPAWVYLENVGIDQCQVNGMEVQGRHVRVSNLNITGGTFRLNTGVGLALRPNARNFTMVNSQVTESHNSGLLIENGAKELRFSMCDIIGNHVSGTGVDVDCLGQGPRDPFFDACLIGTRNMYTTGQVINGMGTSRYVYSSRAQQASSAGSSGAALDGYSLPAATFVDQKTVRITASGFYAANANAKAVSLSIGGVPIGAIGTDNGVAWMIEAEVLRIDSNNVWLTLKGNVGATAICNSVLQTPFNSSVALTINLLVTGVAAGDVVKHHFDIELID